MSKPFDWKQALDGFVERVREKFGDEAADEVRASAGALRSEVWESDGVSGIGEASGKEARRAFERAVDQAAKRMGDDPLARRVRKDGRLKDTIAEWLFGLYLEEAGGGHRARAKPPVPQPIEREIHATRAERDEFVFRKTRGENPAAWWEGGGAAPPPRSAPRPVPAPDPPAEAERGVGAATSSEPAPPPQRPEPVFMDACAPKVVRPGDSFSAEFAAYVRGFEAEARRTMGNPDDPAKEVERGIKGGRWAVDAPVTVRLSAPELAVERAERKFAWDGEYQTLDFRVSVPADAPSRRTTLTFEVLVGPMDVGPLILDLEIGAVASAEPARAVAESPATAFVSYSHKDLNAVYHGVSVLQTFYRADFFVDRDSLVQGAPWEEQLGDAIVARDVFLLFWSSNAAASREVEKEWRYALEKKGLRAMRVHLLEKVDVATIPEPFHSLHLDNKWLRLMDHPPAVPKA